MSYRFLVVTVDCQFNEDADLTLWSQTGGTYLSIWNKISTVGAYLMSPPPLL